MPTLTELLFIYFNIIHLSFIFKWKKNIFKYISCLMHFNRKDLLKKTVKLMKFFNGSIRQKSDYTKNCFEHKSVIFSQILLKLMAFFWKQTASNFSHVAYKLQWAKWINRSWDGSRLHSAAEIKLRNLESKKAAYSFQIEKRRLIL